MAAANIVGDEGGDGDGAVGRVIDARYFLEERLGQGGATAYGARDQTTGERCALKLFRVGSPLEEMRAAEEFRRLHELGHPNVVRVRDLGRCADGALFLVTDEVRGPPVTSIAAILDEAARRRAFEIAARELCDALAYLHGRGVAHGDVAPANVRLDAGGRPVLFDFGLAGPGASGGSVAAAGASGTLGYASPEALVGERTAAGDLQPGGDPLRDMDRRRAVRRGDGGRAAHAGGAGPGVVRGPRRASPRVGRRSCRACCRPSPRGATPARASCCARSATRSAGRSRRWSWTCAPRTPAAIHWPASWSAGPPSARRCARPSSGCRKARRRARCWRWRERRVRAAAR